MAGLTISIAWVRFRPWIGVPLGLICAGGIIYIFTSFEESK
jgi:hypothetical protein